MSITKIHAREILDSRGNPTVEVDLWTAKGKGTVLQNPVMSLWANRWLSQVSSGQLSPAERQPGSTRRWSSAMETRAVTWAKVGGRQKRFCWMLVADGSVTPVSGCRNSEGCGSRQQGDRPQTDREGEEGGVQVRLGQRVSPDQRAPPVLT